MEISAIFYAIIFIAGLVIGSFCNVAIYRWPKEDPKEREWVFTPSHCPKCNVQILWYDNVPLLSYIFLGGKCRACKLPIHWRYPAIELGHSLLWVATAWVVSHHGLTRSDGAEMTWLHVSFACFFVTLLYLTIIIDSMTGLIPHEISIAFFVGAWAFVFLCNPSISSDWLDSLIGMFTLSILFFIFYLLRWMGGGDASLILGFGVLFGWKLLLVSWFIAILLGGIIAIAIVAVLLAKKEYEVGKTPIPFGPFLALGAFAGMFAGQRIFDWYLNLVGF